MNDLSQALGYNFVADEVEISSYEPVPEGEYAVMITEAKLQATSTGGQMLVFDYTIQGSAHDGRVVTDRLNIVNKKEKTQKIALESLAKLSLAVGINSPKLIDEYVNKRLKIKVIVQEGKPYVNSFGEEKPGNPQNSVRGYYPINSSGASVAPKQPETTVAPAEQPSAAPTRPWASK